MTQREEDRALTDRVIAKILDHEAKLVKEAEAGQLLPWQQEELAIVRDLLRNIRHSWRGRLH